MALTKITGEGVGTLSSSGATTATFNRTTSNGSIIDLQKDGTAVGSIGTASGDLIIGTGDTGLFFNDSTNQIHPYNIGSLSGGSVDGAIDLGQSGVRWKDLYLSGGVYLGGTGSANKLDDYEEGTWTPTCGDNIGGLAVLSASEGNYTKIGRKVHLNFYIKVSGTGTTTGANGVHVGNLPFTVSNNLSGTGIEASGAVGFYDASATTINSPTWIANDSSLLVLYGLTSSTASAKANLTWTNVGGSVGFRGSITYFSN